MLSETPPTETNLYIRYIRIERDRSKLYRQCGRSRRLSYLNRYEEGTLCILVLRRYKKELSHHNECTIRSLNYILYRIIHTLHCCRLCNAERIQHRHLLTNKFHPDSLLNTNHSRCNNQFGTPSSLLQCILCTY